MTWRSRFPFVVLLVISVILVLFGIGDIISGPAADPAITLAIAGRPAADVQALEPTGFRLYDFAIRMGGLNLLVSGLLFIAVLVGPYRWGQRWAWSTMWLLAAWSLAVPVLYVAFGPASATEVAPPAISGPIIATIVAIALLADRRRFLGHLTPTPSPEPEPA